MLWILVLLIAVAVLIHLATRGKSTGQKIEEINLRMQARREDFQKRHGRPAPF